EEGQKRFPKSPYFTLNLAQLAFNQGKLDKSEAYVLRALEQDPQNTTLLNFLGGLAEQQQNLDKAAEWYLKSLAVKADEYDANYNLGRTYYNQAVELFNVQNPTKLSDDKAKGFLAKAVPYLEAAYKLKPEDVYYVLSNTYDRLDRKADAERIRAAHQ
ncbi:MAG: tetratricopeptide repeat protein, partial [Porphyromonas sp.]|nr:tetratricopeptide repeat protein [Porphyromonas sp.]